MRLTDEEIDLIRVSFYDLLRISSGGDGLFYNRLFDIAPGLRPLFPDDVASQGVKLMSMLGSIVAQLHDHETLMPIVGDLARRHVSYGTTPAHYEVIGEALFWTLARGLGERFTPAVETAWSKGYRFLAAAMIEAAYPPADADGTAWDPDRRRSGSRP